MTDKTVSCQLEVAPHLGKFSFAVEALAICCSCMCAGGGGGARQGDYTETKMPAINSGFVVLVLPLLIGGPWDLFLQPERLRLNTERAIQGDSSADFF